MVGNLMYFSHTAQLTSSARPHRSLAKCGAFYCSSFTCSQDSPREAWTSIAGSATYENNTGSPCTLTSPCFQGGARRERRDRCIWASTLGLSLVGSVGRHAHLFRPQKSFFLKDLSPDWSLLIVSRPFETEYVVEASPSEY